MDPFCVLGVTASLITCIQLSGALLKRVGPSDYSKKELNHVLKALYGFRGAYEGIKSYLELNEDDEARLSALKELEAPLRDCKVALEFLEERLRNVNFVGKYIVGSLWDGRFRRLLQRLEDAKGLFELALHADQQIIMKAVESYIRNVAEDVHSIQTTINENGKRLIDIENRAEENHEQSKKWHRDIGDSIHQISVDVLGHYSDAKDWKFDLEKRDKQEHRQKVHQWLSPPDSSSNYNAACRKREPMTGSWFIEREEFAAWKANPGLFMWLHGIPGCGKTILTSTIIEDTISYCEPSPTQVVAYFYFDFNDEGKLLVKHLLSSIITQLCTQMTAVPGVLETAYSRSENGRQEPKIDDLSIGLKELISMPYQIYMIIDALDECTERDELLEFVAEVVSWNGNLHLLVASRKERDIEEATESLVTSQICIQSELVNADIQRHVSRRLMHDPKLKRWPTPVKEEIKETLVRGANGMFRWAVCQLDALRKCLTINSLRKTLKSLPKTLDDTYERILTNIDEEYIQDAIKVLQCLAYAPRPLLIGEVAEVLAVDVDRELRFDAGRRLPEPRDILRICSSLVTLSPTRRNVSNTLHGYGHADDSDDPNDPDNPTDPEQPDYFDRIDGSGETGRLGLAHFSVKEYLVSERIRTGSASIFHLNETAAALSMARTCIVYLLQFDSAGLLSRNTLYNFPIAELSAQYWLQYVEEVGDRGDSTLDSLILKLLESQNESFANWIRICDPVEPWKPPNFARVRQTIAPPLYYVSLCGSPRVVELLLDRGADIVGANLEAQGVLGRTALMAAAWWGNDAVVQLLIEKGANIEARDCDGETALMVAACRGNDTVVQLLIEKGANIGAGNNTEETALMLAAVHGNDTVMRLLIEKGANIDVRDYSGETALILATLHGSDAAVRLLVEKEANIDAKNDRGNGVDIGDLGRGGCNCAAANRRGSEYRFKG